MQDQLRGLCACGCGQRTKLSVKGEPLPFLAGHAARKSPVDYLVEDRGYTTPCWVWQLALGKRGYGNLRVDGRTVAAHRFVYERDVGPIPPGLDLDHLCFVTACVNPAHLEPVTRAENTARTRRARSAYCAKGHEFTPENTRVHTNGNGKRQCRTCMRQWEKERSARRREQRKSTRCLPLGMCNCPTCGRFAVYPQQFVADVVCARCVDEGRPDALRLVEAAGGVRLGRTT